MRLWGDEVAALPRRGSEAAATVAALACRIVRRFGEEGFMAGIFLRSVRGEQTETELLANALGTEHSPTYQHSRYFSAKHYPLQ